MARPARFAYLHGFASGPASTKGNAFAAAFQSAGAELHLPDLNVPSFERLTYGGMLAGVDALDRRAAVDGLPWGFVGSSMGGWVAARWAELQPERVVRLLLLAPGFDLANRWRNLIDDDQLRAWEQDGAIATTDGSGAAARLHWGFMTDARAQPPWPEPRCPTLILHGRRDTVVPVEVSEEYARSRPQVTLEVVDDDHDLLRTLPHLLARALDWFGAGAAG